MSSKIIRFIGDVHGKFRRYKRVISECSKSVQIGDLGIGFIHCGGHRHGQYMANPPFDAMAKGEHLFIRGNHDSPSVCKRHKFWIPDGTVRDNMMFIGGEASIDKEWRYEGFDWWPDEELSISELYSLVDVYLIARPEIMITHGGPTVAIGAVCSYNHRRFHYPSRTTQALQAMWDFHKPRLWIFGHMHHSFDSTIDRTRFICLNELEFIDVDTETMEVDHSEWRRRNRIK